MNQAHTDTPRYFTVYSSITHQQDHSLYYNHQQNFSRIHLERVGQIVEVNLAGGDGALAGDEGPVDDAADREHGKASVLELCATGLDLGDLISALAEVYS